MTDPGPQLIDTIARALRKELHGDNDSMDLLPAALADAAISRYRRAARTGLAAMPQPIGYGALIDGCIESTDWESADEPGALDYARARAALGDGIVVALVPVEGDAA